jgi:putative SOS response-associated peptidase YedK
MAPTWLGEESVDRLETLKTLLAPYLADGMVMWPVDKRVGNVWNNDPSLSEPVELAELDPIRGTTGRWI